MRFLLLMSFFFIQFGFSQQINGTIKDSIKLTPIPYITVLLKSISNNNKVVSYVTTNSNGEFSFKIGKIENYTIETKSLNHKIKAINISSSELLENKHFLILLSDDYKKIEPIIIKSELPIKTKKDTIIYNLKKFTNGNENNIEDILKKLPGIDVSKDGTIKVEGKEIKSILIEGDDFFNNDYQLISKNMPSFSVEKVEIIKNYNKNKFLKDYENLNQNAINLKLSENYKNSTFGNSDLGYGFFTENIYNLRLNLINISKKNKFFILTNLNNIGDDPISNSTGIIESYDENNYSNFEKNKINSPIQNNIDYLEISKNKYNFNNAEFFSLNLIKNINKKSSISLTNNYLSDDVNFSRNSVFTFNDQVIFFTNNESYNLKKHNKEIFNGVDYKYNFNNSKELNIKFSNRINFISDFSKIIYNASLFNENQNSKYNKLTFNPNFIKKTKSNKLLLFNGELILEKKPVNYKLIKNNTIASTIDNIIFNNLDQDLFSSKIETNFKNKRNKIHYEISVGNLFEKQSFTSNLYEDTYNHISINKTNYQAINSYFKNNIILNLSDLNINSSIKIDNTFFKSENFNVNKTYFDFNIDLIKNINKIHFLFLSLKHQQKPIEFEYLIPNLTLNNFNTFSKGLNNFDIIDTNSLTLNYNSSQWLKKIHINTSFNYQFNNKFISSRSLIDEDRTIINYIILNNRNTFSYNFNTDRFINIISSRLKYKFIYSQTKSSNLINESDIRNLKSKTIINGIELKSGFLGCLNFTTGYELTHNSINTNNNTSILSNKSFFNLEINLSKKINLDINFESIRYKDSNNNKSDLFLIDTRVELKLKKYSFYFYGTNLLNNDTFSIKSINDHSTYLREYKILPRYLLLLIKIPIK